MRLYLDKSNLVSFIKNAESLGGELYQDCKRMIKRHLHVHYNFAKDELSGADNLLMAWFLGNGTTGHGYGENTDTFLSCEYPNRPVKSNFLKERDVDDHMAVYLLDADVSSLQKFNTVLIGGVGEEIAILKHLVFADYSFHRLHDIQNKSEFSGWEQLDQQGDILPTSDILILDRYLFGGAKDIQEVDLENNLYTILGLYAKKNLQKINIVFFCDGVRNSKVWSDRKSKIEKIFKKEHIERQRLIQAVEPTWDQRVKMWRDEKYQGKGFQEGIPVILTDRGERVRSKTEKIMADYFYRKGI